MKRTPEQLAAERDAVFQAIAAGHATPDPGIRCSAICEATGLEMRRVDAALQYYCRDRWIICDPYPYWRLTDSGLAALRRFDRQNGMCMSERQNVHVILPSSTVLALDLMAMVKTDIGPAAWSRAACIREAIDEYISRRKISGDDGSYSIRIEDEAAMRDAEATEAPR